MGVFDTQNWGTNLVNFVSNTDIFAILIDVEAIYFCQMI